MTILVTARIFDIDTKEFLFCKDFKLEVSHTFDVKNPDYKLLHYELINTYPDLLPQDYSEVDILIINVELDYSKVDVNISKKQVISLLNDNGIKANYKNTTITDTFVLNTPYIVIGYCIINNDKISFRVYPDYTIDYEYN